jgi:hypothetical protein
VQKDEINVNEGDQGHIIVEVRVIGLIKKKATFQEGYDFEAQFKGLESHAQSYSQTWMPLASWANTRTKFHFILFFL